MKLGFSLGHGSAKARGARRLHPSNPTALSEFSTRFWRWMTLTLPTGAYAEHCESMWKSWITGTLRASEFLRSRFDMDAAPEPWLPFGGTGRRLYVLTTNPGATLPLQRRDEILTGRSPVMPT